MSGVNILGLTRSSFIDYPSRICAVVFLGGCNFRCPYCHNPEIVKGEGERISEGELLAFLEKRKNFLDGVCISGGEPTLSEGLPGLIRQVKSFGYAVKLDTNGTNPGLLKSLLTENLLDYIAMDIKAPLEKYEKVTRAKVDLDAIKESIELISQSGVSYEFRTTVAKELLARDDLTNIASLIPGARLYCIQNFRKSGELLGGDADFTPYAPQELQEIEKSISPLVKKLVIR